MSPTPAGAARFSSACRQAGWRGWLRMPSVILTRAAAAHGRLARAFAFDSEYLGTFGVSAVDL
jgi:hypothetical protein